MNRIFLLVFFCAVCLRHTAQNDSASQKKWAHELGLSLYDQSLNGGDFYSGYRRTLSNYAFSGIYLKFYARQNVIRTSLAYQQQILLRQRFFSNTSHVISSNGWQLALGYQRMLGKKSTALYVFADLNYKYMRTLRATANSYLYLDYYPQSRLNYNYSSLYSIGPGIGIRIQLNKYLLLSFESASQFYYSTEFDNGLMQRHEVIGINIKTLNCSLGLKF